MSGSRAQGKTYEKRVGEFLRNRGYSFRSGVWIDYEDDNGVGYAQIDHLLILPDRLCIVEAKLSQTCNAELQIRELYRPLLKLITGGGLIQGVQVCKNLYTEPQLPVRNIEEVLATTSEEIFTWHFLGRG